jgi:hypothetical protein
MMENEIKELTEEVRSWRDEQKEQITALRKILMGNGSVGVCEIVRQMSSQMKALWTLIGIIGCAIMGGLVKLLFFS